MKRFVCWRPERLGDVLNTVATQMEDEVFLAVHTPMLIREGTVATQDVVVTEPRLIAKFGDESRDFTFVPVIGASGSGKSHLIRWLSARFPSTESRRTLLVPKLNTNLRDFVGLVLRNLEGEEFEAYRARLDQAPQGMGNRARVRNELLDYLATAVGPSAHPGLDPDATLEGYICHSLPNLLHDPHFRANYWLVEGGIIDQLVEHVLGRRETVEDRETRRQFSLEDLPLQLTDVVRAGQDARDFFSFLIQDAAAQAAAVNWLNKNLDEAVTRVLNFTGTDLQHLMTDVRKALARRGLELVVLIEDFAVLQGIDLALLEALLADPRQFGDDDPLCAIRTALACTTGYFRSLPDTVRTRSTFILTMDVSVGDGGSVGFAQISDFASRYLNAARLPQDQLRGWFPQALEGDDHVPPPTFCDQCPYRDECHGAFGAVEGRGLYPFNATAIRKMFDRVAAADGSRFNPRAVINEILRPTLGDHQELKEGRFPSPLLHNRYGSKLPAEVVHEIRRRDPGDADRRLALLDLWSDSRSVVDLNSTIHSAFDLKPLGVRSDPGPYPPPPPPPPPPPHELAPKLSQIDEWLNGATLPERLRTELRELVYVATRDRVDWDAEGITRSYFDKPGGYVRVTSFNFIRQQTRLPASHKQAIIIVPAKEAELPSAALALKGALKARHYGNWRFPDGGGGEAYRLFTNLIEQCAADLVRQLKTKWDPIPLAAGILCTGARLDGAAGKSTPSVVELVEAMFRQPAPTGEARSGEFKRLQNYMGPRRRDVAALVRAFTSSSKGERQGPYIDPARVVKAVRKFKRTWTLPEGPPPSPPDTYQVLIDAREKLAGAAPVFEAERQQARTWLAKVLDLIGDVRDAEAVATPIEQAALAAQSVGLFRMGPGARSDELVRAARDFRRVPLASTLNAAESVINAEDERELLYQVGQLDVNKSQEVLAFLEKAERFLNETTAAVESQFTRLGGNEQELNEIVEAIGEIIRNLRGAVGELAGERR